MCYRALQNLQDIFGMDFDFSEFDKYDKGYSDEDEIDEDSYYDEQVGCFGLVRNNTILIKRGCFSQT